jgi:hypothetical protein
VSRLSILASLVSFVCVLSSLSLQPLSGATISINSTGVNSSGEKLTPGTTDGTYTLTLNGLNGEPNSYVAEGSPTIQQLGVYNIPAGWPIGTPYGWYAPANMDAQWIAPQSDVVGIPGVDSNTFYVYQTTFDLTGLNPSTADLQGFWAADNYVTQVLLNGTPVYTNSSSVLSSDPNCFSFQNPTDFNINSGFTKGQNTLSFYVTNDTCHNTPPYTNPTGLLVDFTSATAATDTSIPEPATVLLTGIGLAFAAGLGRRRG